MEQIKEVSWKQLKGNKFTLKIAPKMLNGVYHHPRKGKVNNDNYGGLAVHKENILVVKYDREYVITYIIEKIFNPLRLNRTDMLKLINEAYDIYELNLFSEQSEL